MQVRGSQSARSLSTLKLAIAAGVPALAVIAAAAYASAELGVPGWLAGLASILVILAVCAWVLRRASRVDDAHEAASAHERAALAADGERRRASQLAERRRELCDDPDPARRRYVARIDAGELIDDAEIARREARIAELRADPAKHRYLDAVFAGARIDDAMIAYWADPVATALCAHLREVEAALRKLDTQMTLAAPSRVVTRHALDLPKLRARHALAPCVEFTPTPPRAEGDDMLRCTECDSVLFSSSAPEAPTYPP